MKQNNSITQDELKQLMEYNPETGNLIWKSARKKGSIAGARVGYVHHSGYRYCEVNGKHYAAHRLAWLYSYGILPDCQIDHKDSNRDNNSLSNLRLAINNHKDNSQNRAVNKTSKTGIKGVNGPNKYGKYMARITVNKVTIFLGEFNTILDAGAAYKEAKFKYHPFQPED